MTATATAVVDSSPYTAIPVTFSFNSLFRSTHFAYLFPNLTLNTVQVSARLTIVYSLVDITEFRVRQSRIQIR